MKRFLCQLVHIKDVQTLCPVLQEFCDTIELAFLLSECVSKLQMLIIVIKVSNA